MRRASDIAAIPPAFLTSEAHHIELADEIAEDDCAFSGRNLLLPKAGKQSDRRLQVFAGAEGNLLAGLDVDCFTRRRIAAHASSTTPHL